MFSELRILCLKKALEIMKLPLDKDSKDLMKLVARQTAILSAVVTATTRIEATALRGRVKNKFDEILKAITEEEAKGRPPN
jgi:hypothetical protein